MKISTPPARFAVFLIIAATLACLLPTVLPRPCNALAISKGLSFYANDLEYYYQNRRAETRLSNWLRMRASPSRLTR